LRGRLNTARRSAGRHQNRAQELARPDTFRVSDGAFPDERAQIIFRAVHLANACGLSPDIAGGKDRFKAAHLLSGGAAVIEDLLMERNGAV
jgi:hypothetical protein